MNRNYFQQSRTLLYSYLISLPLLILYEILIQVSQPNAEYIVRISVDAWFKQMFATFGLNALNVTFYIAAIAGLWILWRDRKKLRAIRLSTFLFMLIEALLYAIGLALVISLVLESLLMQVGQTKLQLLALSLGAGLYEELFFRVILVSLFVWALSKIISRRWIASWTAVLVAAACFSLAHYLGA
ncbi:MAG: CPBP family glutamic-type intramembrane protease, partial [Balneolaceae bacterium]